MNSRELQFKESHVVRDAYVFLVGDKTKVVDRIFTDENEAKGYKERNPDREMIIGPLIILKDKV